jgi:gliding motility-associated-like protein
MINKLLFIALIFVTFHGNSQTIIMGTGTSSNTCSGTFYDSGGNGANYGDNENFTYTICPDAPGMLSQVNFTSFDLVLNEETLTIYNGPDNTYDVIGTFNSNSPGLITASLNTPTPNPNGCLTFVFSSDGSNTATGWEANISCFEPCQDITASIDVITPAPDPDGILRVCQGEQITFDGSATFSVDGTGAGFELFMGDGVSITGALINDTFNTFYTYNTEGIYEVNLVVYDDNPNGCFNSNSETVTVYVSSTPDFTGTQATDTEICLGESTTIEGVVTGVTQVEECNNGGVQTALPDGPANPGSPPVAYTSELLLDCFTGQVLTDISQLENICINIEHSYVGDLEIVIISPNGTRVLLNDQSSFSYHLGDPITTDGTGPGTGWDYCFSMSATETLLNGPRVQSGTPNPALAIEAGTYLPQGDFNAFVGTPIDGIWTLEITDWLNQDDGTIFNWSINFDESLLVPDNTFTPTYTSETWDADPSIIATVGNIITVQPSIAGTNCYTFRVLDDFGCEYTEQVCIDVNPAVTPTNPTPLELCDDLTADGFTVFDLTVKNVEITGGNPDWVVSYFENDIDAQNNNNPISPVTSYTNTTVNTQVIHARVTDSNTDCYGVVPLTLNVLTNPVSLADAPTLELCDDNNPGDLQEVFDLTLNEAYILNGEVGVTATYYESFSDAENMINQIVTPTAYTNTSSPQTIYVRITNDVTACNTIVDFEILVNPLPATVAILDVFNCEPNSDGVHQFDLDLKTLEILNGRDPLDFQVTYHESQVDADNGFNPLISPYTNIANPQVIYVSITDLNTNCSDSSMTFNIEEIDSPSANQNMPPYVLCDDFGANDGVALFDLQSQDALVLNGQDPLIYEVTYYASQDDADFGLNPLALSYENESNPQIIYARVDDTTANNDLCYATTTLTLEVNLLPEFSLEDSYVICVNTNGTETIGPPLLDTGLSAVDYTFQWSLGGIPIVGATDTSYLALQPGDYSVTATDIISNCQRIESTTVVESSPPVLNAVVASLAFSDNNVIEVEALGSGDYEYSLDNGPWQDSNVFENVSLGEHTIIVRDKIGCGYAMTTVIVMDYPKYFTPNGDGYHDTWHIAGIDSQPNSIIYIFDRYGKLLKQLSPLSQGWDGTFNGYNLPTSDYWFTVQYIEPTDGIQRTFKAHFTLKR